MSDANTPKTRAERLAEQLRDNLKRRKAQSRAMGPRVLGERDADHGDSRAANSESVAALPKSPPSR